MSSSESVKSLLEHALREPCRVTCVSEEAAQRLRWALFRAKKEVENGHRVTIKLKGRVLELEAKHDPILSIEPMETSK